MVLTTFECWAHGDGAGDAATAGANFETGPTRAAVNDVFNPRVVSHMTSNGYYGYVYVNDANNNNNNNSNSNVEATSVQAGVAARCKKRCFVNDGSSAAAEMDNFFNEAAGETEPAMAKRCRFDDGDLTAQYFNDFFSLPATQIGTQTCLMDCDMPAAGGFTEQPPQAIHIIEQYQQQQQFPRLNQHYQGHLHRANRDVSRCMMSHMI